MKMNFKNVLLSAMLAIVATACLTTQARDKTLLPALRGAWPGVHADLMVGVEDAAREADVSAARAAVTELDSALEEGDQARISGTSWTALEPYGQRGIQVQVTTGVISPLVAPSLRERLRQFGEALAKMRITP